MKGFRVFGIIVVAFALITGLVLLSKKRSYEWNPTFGYDDDEPFGCELFDKMVTRSMGDRYTVEHQSVSLHKLSEQRYEKPQGWLFVDYQLRLTATETKDLLSLARRGDCILLNSTTFGQPLCDSLNISMEKNYPGPTASKLEDAMSTFNDEKVIAWMEDHRRDNYTVSEIMVMRQFSIDRDSLPCDVLACYANDSDEFTKESKLPDRIVAASLRMGKGEIIIVSTPLMFTNYGMLSGRGSQYIFRLLSRFGNKPVHRVMLKTHSSEREENMLAMLDYISEQPPLWWAWCLTILLIVLFMLTNARRRQRVIPVMTPPQNHSLEFVRLIGTLYYQQGSHTDLLEKKLRYTSERLRRELHIDITEPQEDRLSATVIAQNTDLTPDEAEEIIKKVRQQLSTRQGINEEQMRYYIDLLNRLTPS